MEWEKRERMKRNESKWKQKFEKPKSKRVLPVTLSWFDIVIEKKKNVNDILQKYSEQKRQQRQQQLKIGN